MAKHPPGRLEVAHLSDTAMQELSRRVRCGTHVSSSRRIVESYPKCESYYTVLYDVHSRSYEW